MGKQDSIKKLENDLWLHKINYYYGTPSISDYEYDLLERSLKKLKPESYVLTCVGAPIPGKHKSKHEVFMGSLNNAMSLEELMKFIKDNEDCSDYRYSFSDKLDGASIELIYKSKRFMKAITRGDGEEGQDVTANVIKMKNLPIKNKNLGNCVIHAEIVMKYDDFNSVNCIMKKCGENEYSNVRNAASGILQREDGKYSEYLSIYAYRILISSKCRLRSEQEGFVKLKENGFKIPHIAMSSTYEEVENIVKKYSEMRNEKPYCVDGIVIRIMNTDVNNRLGYKNGRPNWSIAYKFPAKKYVTKLKSVKWQVGRNGTLTPVAIVKPVDIDGATVKKASLYNFEEINRLNLCINDKVEIVRSGDVIPKIISVFKESKKRVPISLPGKCPACGCIDLISKGANVYCDNDFCVAKAKGKLLNWVNNRNIMNLNKSIFDCLINNEIVNNISDLYVMNVDSIKDLYLGNGILGEKRAIKIIEELEKSKDITIAEFYGSIGIPGCSITTIDKIVKYFEIARWDQLCLESVIDNLLIVDGVGEVLCKNLKRFLKANKNEIENIASHMRFKCNSGKLNNLSFCITGTLSKPRKEIEQKIIDNGGLIKGFSKNLDYLVAGEKSGSKLNKAKNANIKVITEDVLNGLLV
jgi:DNA ligase (NAD+)